MGREKRPEAKLDRLVTMVRAKTARRLNPARRSKIRDFSAKTGRAGVDFKVALNEKEKIFCIKGAKYQKHLVSNRVVLKIKKEHFIIVLRGYFVDMVAGKVEVLQRTSRPITKDLGNLNQMQIGLSSDTITAKLVRFDTVNVFGLFCLAVSKTKNVFVYEGKTKNI